MRQRSINHVARAAVAPTASGDGMGLYFVSRQWAEAGELMGLKAELPLPAGVAEFRCERGLAGAAGTAPRLQR